MIEFTCMPSTRTVVSLPPAPLPYISTCSIARAPPMSGRLVRMPGTRVPNEYRLLPVGIASSVSRVRTSVRSAC